MASRQSMKTKPKPLRFIQALIVSLALSSGGSLAAQTFTTLYNFTNGMASDPIGSLVLSGDILYGTTQSDRNGVLGTVFAVNTNGAGFTNLCTFTAGRDGDNPYAVILSGTSLYGSAWGSVYNATIFRMNTDGTGFTNISDLVGPIGLTLSGEILFGVSDFASNSGTVFQLNTDGSGYATLYAFTPALVGYPNESTTNTDGAEPIYPPVISGDTLYGTAGQGGQFGNGTVFKIGTNGNGFALLHTFTQSSGFTGNGTNSDGIHPGALILSRDTLYGTTVFGGSSSNGTVFSIHADGTGFTVLHTFSARAGPNATNSDGAWPSPYLLLSGNTLYGTTIYGGTSSNGTAFALQTDGSAFAVLHNFTAYSNGTNSDGGAPFGGLTISGSTLFGTAEFGGAGGGGTVFSISLPPQLGITASGPNVVLTWPTNVAGLTLQSTPSLVTPVVWTSVSSGPVVVNGLNTVTNPVVGTQQFYRLSQ
jgi:uncharacterized repeat protein (TIGR03803 family)